MTMPADIQSSGPDFQIATRLEKDHVFEYDPDKYKESLSFAGIPDESASRLTTQLDSRFSGRFDYIPVANVIDLRFNSGADEPFGVGSLDGIESWTDDPKLSDMANFVLAKTAKVAAATLTLQPDVVNAARHYRDESKAFNIGTITGGVNGLIVGGLVGADAAHDAIGYLCFSAVGTAVGAVVGGIVAVVWNGAPGRSDDIWITKELSRRVAQDAKDFAMTEEAREAFDGVITLTKKK